MVMRKQDNPTLTLADLPLIQVEIDGFIPPIAAHDLGGRWNGCRTPTFTREQAFRLLEVMSADRTPDNEHPEAMTGSYDVKRNCFCFTSHAETRAGEEDEVYAARKLADGIEVYDIGAYCWAWNEAEEEVPEAEEPYAMQQARLAAVALAKARGTPAFDAVCELDAFSHELALMLDQILDAFSDKLAVLLEEIKRSRP